MTTKQKSEQTRIRFQSSHPVFPFSTSSAPGRHQNTLNMQNDAGEFVDLFIPRKCSASNRIVGAKDHASIQINFAEVDPTTGRMTGAYKTYAVCGYFRRMLVSTEVITLKLCSYKQDLSSLGLNVASISESRTLMKRAVDNLSADWMPIIG
ncbi:40S ribosomal protein S21 [Elysia marginata]|uniref:Small ribosomal subunit protein eS21 n=1 Tax=Elysia marginata TaxID=1093978 RepID=A0AAV4JH53_9GAST|nr:40S ribosomal protein S21 [Elysia marginata]